MKTNTISSEVVVVGGGIAGISAALAARRSGKKTILLESTYMLGGLATSGLVVIYLPLCDGKGHQVSYGIAEELLKLSMSKGADGMIPTKWMVDNSIEERSTQRYQVLYNAQVFAILAEQLLIKEGVKILYGVTCNKVNVVDGRIKSVRVCSRAHSSIIKGEAFIDCTGDATVAEMAGEKTKLSIHQNIEACWYCETSNNEYRLKYSGDCSHLKKEPGTYKSYLGLSSKDLSYLMISAHKSIIDKFLKDGEESPTHALSTINTIPHVRTTRSIVGLEDIDIKNDGVYIEDSVGTFSNWVYSGPKYELPYKSLFGEKIDNLYVAGRCISVVDDLTWDITRVIPVCAVTGEACGVMAGMFSNNKEINVKEVQNELIKRGAKVHL